MSPIIIQNSHIPPKGTPVANDMVRHNYSDYFVEICIILGVNFPLACSLHWGSSGSISMLAHLVSTLGEDGRRGF